MDALQFIIPDLDITPIQEHIQTHAAHALEILNDPDTALNSEVGKFELERLSAASDALDDLYYFYLDWQWKRKQAREYIITLLEKLEEFDKEPEGTNGRD